MVTDEIWKAYNPRGSYKTSGFFWNLYRLLTPPSPGLPSMAGCGCTLWQSWPSSQTCSCYLLISFLWWFCYLAQFSCIFISLSAFLSLSASMLLTLQTSWFIHIILKSKDSHCLPDITYLPLCMLQLAPHWHIQDLDLHSISQPSAFFQSVIPEFVLPPQCVPQLMGPSHSHSLPAPFSLIDALLSWGLVTSHCSDAYMGNLASKDFSCCILLANPTWGDGTKLPICSWMLQNRTDWSCRSNFNLVIPVPVILYPFLLHSIHFLYICYNKSFLKLHFSILKPKLHRVLLFTCFKRIGTT